MNCTPSDTLYWLMCLTAAVMGYLVRGALFYTQRHYRRYYKRK